MKSQLIRIVAWTIGVSIAVISLIIVLLYGQSFGYIKSILWLSAFVLSFATSMLIVEPIKQFALSSYLTMFTSPTPFEINENQPHQCNRWTQYHKSFEHYTCTVLRSNKQTYSTVSMLTEKYLIYYRQLSSDLLVFSLYLITLLMVIIGSRDRMAYQSNRVAPMYAEHSKFVRGPLMPIISKQDLHFFFSYVLIPTLHSNKTDLKYTGWLPEKHVKLLGVVRLRQHRVKSYCDVQKTAPKFLSSVDCARWFEHSERDTMAYNSEWGQYKTMPYRDRFPRICEPWVYRSAWQTQAVPIFGQSIWYSGGGYTVNLGRTLGNSKSVLRYIRRSKWIDRRTTVVFAEFTLYGVDSNLFNVVTIVAEQTPFGSYQVSSNIQTVKLLLTLENISGAELMLFVAYIIFASIFVIRVIQQLLNHRLLDFLRNAWNVLDTIIVALSIGMVVMFFQRDQYVQRLVETLDRSRNNMFVSFYYAAFFDQLLTWWSSVLVMMATMRIWKIFHFINVFRVITHTFARAACTLFSLSLATGLLVVILSFCVFLINGPYTKTFSSMTRTITSMTVLAFGFADEHINSRDMLFGGKWVGIVLHVVLIVILTIYAMSMFVTIVCYYFTEVRQTWQMERLPFSYWRFLRDEFDGWRRSVCAKRGKTVELKDMSALEKNIARIEIIDFQLNVVNETLDALLKVAESRVAQKKMCLNKIKSGK